MHNGWRQRSGGPIQSILFWHRSSRKHYRRGSLLQVRIPLAFSSSFNLRSGIARQEPSILFAAIPFPKFSHLLLCIQKYRLTPNHSIAQSQAHTTSAALPDYALIQPEISRTRITSSRVHRSTYIFLIRMRPGNAYR